ncbi:hypothetical protein [Streptomyces sp. AN091965]|uniref:hypothetical protein n=1 Tax=Streptomyces sp. AN091965 TaxID=2927803 RepID=UPI001F61DAD2|nr:hypothetical protein [Streptomyces sp. AN091965]MCI3928059.1 hypothetical protein [Streptomyces sp. AN091965]
MRSLFRRQRVRRHFTDEPVAWEPSAHWLDTLGLPQPHLDLPDERVCALLTAQPTAHDTAVRSGPDQEASA